MAKSATSVGPLMCALPNPQPTLGLHMMRNTTSPAGLNSLDSIATAAVKLLSSTGVAATSASASAANAAATLKKTAFKTALSDKEERLKERRSQIAAASRKSRAKRKREHSVLKEENELLLLEVSALRKRLRTYTPGEAPPPAPAPATGTPSSGINIQVKREQYIGISASSLDERDTNRMTIAPLKKKLVSRYSSDALKVEEAKLTREAKSEAQKEIFERVKAVISPDLRARLTAEPELDSDESLRKRGCSTLEETLSDARGALEPAMEENPVLKEILSFFHKQLEEYFAFLKSDVVGHFGSNFSKEKREALLDLSLRFLSP